MQCPVCHERYAFFEKRCSRCNVNLVSDPAVTDGDSGDLPREVPQTELVSVFRTDEPGVVPLAEIALQGEGIPYAVQNAGKADSLQWQMSQQPTNRPVVLEILVPADASARARDLLVDLENPAAALATPDPPAELDPAEPATIRLDDAETQQPLGAISEAQLQMLTSHLEEDAQHDYFINGPTLELLRDAHADAGLVAILRDALGDRDGMVIRWSVR